MNFLVYSLTSVHAFKYSWESYNNQHHRIIRNVMEWEQSYRQYIIVIQKLFRLVTTLRCLHLQLKNISYSALAVAMLYWVLRIPMLPPEISEKYHEKLNSGTSIKKALEATARYVSLCKCSPNTAECYVVVHLYFAVKQSTLYIALTCLYL
jgi:hypothetical protein